MRVRALTLVVALVVVACGESGDAGDNGDTDSPEMMAAALEQLVTVDHTFGEGPPPFTEYLLQTSTDPFAGNPTGDGDESRLLTDDERQAIEAVISELGPVRWIDDPDEWRTPDLRPTVDGAVILGVGEATVEGETGLVPVSLWCGGLCGTWMTYGLEEVDGAWTVTGIEGPIAMS